MKRALRRKHRTRIIRKWNRLFAHWDMDELWAKKVAGRGSMGCGCCICANPRRRRGIGEELTIQERKAEIYRKNWEREHNEL